MLKHLFPAKYSVANNGGAQTTDDCHPDYRIYRDIAYQGCDNERYWRADIIVPTVPEETRLPVVVDVHGGGWGKGTSKDLLGWQGGMDWAEEGFVFVRVNYHLSNEAPFPAAIEDVMNAIRFLRVHAETFSIDPDKIGLIGSSAGAQVASMVAYAGDDPFFQNNNAYPGTSATVQSLTLLFGPYDIEAYMKDNSEKGLQKTYAYLGGKEAVTDEWLKKVSPLSYIEGQTKLPPTLLIHATGDPVVRMEQSEHLYAKLKKAGATALFIPHDHQGHGLIMPDGHLQNVSWMKKHLLGQEDAYYDKMR